MRPKLYRVVAGFFGLLLLAVPALAHHSVQATYDTHKLVYITGVFRKFEWTNPHIFAYVDVTDSDGKVTTWTFEGASPNLVTRTGTHREDFASNVGRSVTVRGCPAKDGSPRGSAETIKMPDGREIAIWWKKIRGRRSVRAANS